MKFARSCVLAMACAFGVCTPAAASAASFALLVGVSDYEDSTGISDLRGPLNDVMLLRGTFAARGDFELTVLADGVDGAARPTRAAILTALDDLATRVSTGDFVFIHLSGHGTQQPDTDGDETDGLDEVFLPADTGRAEPGAQRIPNAILDEELGAAVAALRAKGADVWFVLDSCHSGSGLRAAAMDVATRFVDPAKLGIDLTTSASKKRLESPIEAVGTNDLPGKYVAFYAAQSSELAREINVDPDAASGNGWYGLFTSRLAARLDQESTMSYRQLFQAVLSDMNKNDVPGGARLQTPLWEGNLIDAAVLGGQGTIGIRQFPINSLRLDAGLLHGLHRGTLLSLFEDATAGPEDTLGTAQIIDAAAQSATIALVDDTCVPDPAALCQTTGPVTPTTRFARVLAHPIDLTLRLAMPVDLSRGDFVAPDNALRAALNDAIARVNTGASTRIMLVETDADISAGVFDNALWFGRAVAAGNTPVGLVWRPGAQDLDALLVRMFSAERIARMLESVDAGTSILFGNPIATTIRLRDTDMRNRPLSVTNLDDLRQECKASLPSSTIRDMPARGTLNQCDQLFVTARGVMQGPARDVNSIYIDSQFCVETEYARVEGTVVEARLGRPMTVCSDCPSGSGLVQKAGHERLFIVTTEARDNAEGLDLRGLLENCTRPGEAEASRSGRSAAPAAAFLETLSSKTSMRGSFDGMGISSLWVERFDWQVLPRSEAVAQEGVVSD